jgi:hypothetical protein
MTIDHESNFGRAMLTGLFIGIIDTLICLAYNIGFRSFTGYTPSALINVSSLIFAVNLLLLVVGILYGLWVALFGNKDWLFTILFIGLTLLAAWRTELGHRFADAAVNAEFKGLLLGIVLVLGISAAVLPYLAQSKFFEKYVL